MIQRTATKSDINEFRSLWKICFGDSDEFMNWFFGNRFFPEYSACVEVDDTIVSAMQSIPFNLSVRGRLIPSAMVAGVCTHPDHSGKGYMGKMFKFFMKSSREKGIVLTPHTPAKLPTFFSRGHFPVSKSGYIDIEKVESKSSCTPAFHSMSESPDETFKIYSLAAARYSGIVYRSISDHKFKFSDYASDGAKCLLINNKAYAVLYDMPEKVHVEEVMFTDEKAFLQLYEQVLAVAHGKALHAKLPPDAPVEKQLKEQGVCGVANVSRLLNLVFNKKGFAIKVNDASLPENEGIYDLEGNMLGNDILPMIEISAGHLTQWAFGYLSLKELNEQNLITVHDMNALEELDRLFPKQLCFIIDEY